jgi:signal transduction histidine kinase
LTAKLKNKNELLEKKNIELKRFGELKNQFMVISSHELRTPATIISGALELLWDQKNCFNESQQKLLKNALHGSLRLNDIISAFFETLKWNANQNILDTSAVEIDVILRMVVERFYPFLEQRQLTVKQKIDKNLSILGDRKKLYLVFENLMSNAIKYTPDNGQIVLKAFRKELKVNILFQDNGIGIPQAELNNIFNPFYQLGDLKYHHSSRHAFMGGGTGLGLSLCKSIIQAHQGKIRAESKGKKMGSLFTVILPIYE